MKTVNKRHSSMKSGLILAVLTFALLSVFNSGALEFSKDGGTLRWLADTTAYAISYKWGYKLVASLGMMLVGCFVSSMIAYGKQVKSKKRARTTRVQFQKGDTHVSRTA